MDWQLLALSTVRTLSAACAAYLAFTAYRAYRSTGRNGLLWLGVASALLGVGFLAAGVLYRTTSSLENATLLEAPFTLGALLVMIASIHARGARRVRVRTRVDGVESE